MTTPIPPLDTAEIDRLARRRVALKLSWMGHAALYVLVNLLLLALNTAGGGPRWHVWPLAGWGLGLAIHGAVVLFALGGEGLRQRMLQAERERLRQRR